MDEAPKHRERPRSPLRARLLALGVGVVLAPVALELGYRLLRQGALSPTTNPAYVAYDAELGWSYRPGTRARHRSEEFDVEIRINSRGFRGDEWPAMDPQRVRVLVLGDSFAFGWGVSDSATFAARLDELEPGWDVFNAAVSGYGTDQELLLLRRLHDELDPDLVVCLFCPNDLVECSGPVAYGRHKPYFVLGESGPELRGTPVPRPWLERVSQLWGAYRKFRWERAQVPRTIEHAEDWRLVQALYLEMSRELGDVPLLVLSRNVQLERLAERSDLHHLDLEPLLEELGERAHFPLDGHFTEEAHSRVAAAVRLRARELLVGAGD